MSQDVQLNITNVLSGDTLQIQVGADATLGTIRDLLTSLYDLSPESHTQLKFVCAGHTMVDTHMVRDLPTLEVQFNPTKGGKRQGVHLGLLKANRSDSEIRCA